MLLSLALNIHKKKECLFEHISYNGRYTYTNKKKKDKNYIENVPSKFNILNDIITIIFY